MRARDRRCRHPRSGHSRSSSSFLPTAARFRSSSSTVYARLARRSRRRAATRADSVLRQTAMNTAVYRGRRRRARARSACERGAPSVLVQRCQRPEREPAYLRIASDLRRRIRDGVATPGTASSVDATTGEDVEGRPRDREQGARGPGPGRASADRAADRQRRHRTGAARDPRASEERAVSDAREHRPGRDRDGRSGGAERALDAGRGGEDGVAGDVALPACREEGGATAPDGRRRNARGAPPPAARGLARACPSRGAARLAARATPPLVHAGHDPHAPDSRARSP